MLDEHEEASLGDAEPTNLKSSMERRQPIAKHIGTSIIGHALAVVLPDECVACGTPLETAYERRICAACWLSARRLSEPLCTCGYPLADTDSQCAACAAVPSLFQRGRSVFVYESPIREIIHAFKYGGHRSLARQLVRHSTNTLTPASDGILVPVPSHWWTKWKRGFNPADDVARELAHRWNLNVKRVLRKVKRTLPQMALTARERTVNLRGAFALRGGAARVVRGRYIILIDDVYTTGSTLRECAGVLSRAGAKRIDFLTMARTL